MTMDRKKNIKKVFILLLSMAVLLAAMPVNQMYADEMDDTTMNPKISVSSGSMFADDSSYFCVNASNFKDVAGLEFTIYYDEDVVSLEYCNKGYFLYESSCLINTEIPGQIKCSIFDKNYGSNL